MTGVGAPGWFPRVAFLVAFLRLATMDFICASVSFGLVDEGSVRALPFWAFPWPFFYSWGAKLTVLFFGFADFGSSFWGVVSVCGDMVLDLVPSLWGDPDL